MEAVVVVFVLWWLLFFVCDQELGQVQGQGVNFSFPSFAVDSDRLLKVEDVTYDGNLKAYDMNYRTYSTGLLDEECGRVLYKDKVRMVDRASGKAASFNTSFTFAFLQQNATSTSCGSGMTFMFTARPGLTDEELVKRRGKGMCTYDVGDTSPSNRVLAVKFDSALTNVEGFSDPSDSSVGVVVSSLGRTREYTYNLCTGDPNITECSFFCGDKGEFSAWIDYDSGTQTMEVRFRNGSLASGGKPVEPLVRVQALPLNLSILEEEDMYVGFSGSTFWSRELHRVRAWSFNSSDVPITATHSLIPSVGAIVGVAVVVVGVAVIGILFILFRFKHRSKSSISENPKLTSLSSNDAPHPFTYRELKKATKNFEPSELLSGGAFGDVYKGTLPSGRLVAVKRMKNNNAQGEESFLAEATSLRQIRHRNLMQLRGWCQAKEGLLLVYDYMTNGSLDKWIFRPDSGLSWSKRRSILSGVSSGLAYLHEEWVQCVLHRDIKSSNVMLDADFNPYLGDFGLARLIDHEKLEKTTLLAGTLGYMAPEMHYRGRATKETDVYAFGILVLEVICGRRPLARQVAIDPDDVVLLDIVWRAYEAGNIMQVADPKLFVSELGKLGHFDPTAIPNCSTEHLIANSASVPGPDTTVDEKRAIAITLHMGLLCCLPNPSERPSMRVVNQWLQGIEVGTVELPPLPSTKPHSEYSVTNSSDGLKSSLASDVSSFQTWAFSVESSST